MTTVKTRKPTTIPTWNKKTDWVPSAEEEILPLFEETAEKTETHTMTKENDGFIPEITVRSESVGHKIATVLALEAADLYANLYRDIANKKRASDRTMEHAMELHRLAQVMEYAAIEAGLER